MAGVKHIKTRTADVHDNPRIPYLVVNPHSHEDWLYERTLGIGASSCGILVGCHMYKKDTPYQFWRDKLGLNEPVKETWSMRKGHIMEDHVASLFEKETGYKIVKTITNADVSTDWLAVDRDKPYLRVSPDRIYWLGKSRKMEDRGVLEIKSSSHNFQPKDLQDPNKCLKWFCQIQYQMHVMGLKEGYLGFIYDDGPIGGDYWFKHIPYNKKFCKEVLIPAITEFWTHHLKPAKDLLELNKITDPRSISAELLAQLNEYAPPVTEADDVTVRWPHQDSEKQIRASSIGITSLDIDLYKRRRQQIKDLESQQKELEDRIKLAMQDADSVVDEDGSSLVTYRSNKPSFKLDTSLLKSSHPDIYEASCRMVPGPRVFKIK